MKLRRKLQSLRKLTNKYLDDEMKESKNENRILLKKETQGNKQNSQNQTIKGKEIYR